FPAPPSMAFKGARSPSAAPARSFSSRMAFSVRATRASGAWMASSSSMKLVVFSLCSFLRIAHRSQRFFQFGPRPRKARLDRVLLYAQRPRRHGDAHLLVEE